MKVDIHHKKNDEEQEDQLELFKETPVVQTSKFNSMFTLDRFIVGNNNRFAFAAAEAVSKQPAKAYNPLYIYGGVGMGKTHLLNSIGLELKKNNKVMFLSLIHI